VSIVGLFSGFGLLVWLFSLIQAISILRFADDSKAVESGILALNRGWSGHLY